MNGTNGWTGGQYSAFRFVFGAYLFAHFVQLVPWGTELFSREGAIPDGAASPLLHLFPNVLALYDAPWFVTVLLVLGSGLGLLLLVGWYDRAAAVGLWYLSACLVGRNPLTTNPGLPYIGLLLLVHAALPAAPYGSLAARGRRDPEGGWRMPPALHATVWALMAVGYSYSGYTKLASPSWLDGSALVRVLENPLARLTPLRELFLALPDGLLRIATWTALAGELLFAPLALSRRLRPLLWLAMLGMHVSLMVLIDFVDLSLGMVMLHLFTFDPRWVRPKAAETVETLFYDGDCGLCHRAVRFLLAEDPGGRAFRFAPLRSEAFERIPEGARRSLPDSMVLRASNGTLLVRSAAALHLLERLGGLWRALAIGARLVPRRMRDALYDRVAAVRLRLFARPVEACPVLPARLRSRFEA